MEALEKFLKPFSNINDYELADILSKFHLQIYKSGEAISAQGTIVSDYFFVNRGCLKLISEDYDDLSVHACWFANEGEFFTELISLRLKKPSRYSIVANENSEVYLITDADMEYLFQKYPSWQEFGRKLWENAFIRMEERLFSFQTENAEARYLRSLKNGLAQKIPLKELSSFIGITPNSLSRIRKNIR